MKIAIEASTLLVEKKTGVEYYVYRLLNALFTLDQKNKYSLVYIKPFFKPAPNIGLKFNNVKESRILFLTGKIYKIFLRLPFGPGIDLLAGVKPDIFLFPNFAKWHTFWTKRSVVVVHDLAYIDYPDVMKNTRHRLYLNWIVPRSISRSSLVVAVSQHTRKRILEEYGTDPQKVITVEPSVDKDFYRPAPPKEIKRVTELYGINRPYILYLGTLEPRKNIKGVIESFLQLEDNLKRHYQLVIAGGKGWEKSDIFTLIDSAEEGSIIVTGYVPLENMPALYSGSSVFLWPSFYEGWGMPVLEAMACGAPVITSNNSSIPEAGGNAALYVDAKDTEDISEKIKQVLTNPSEADKMRAAGFEWVQNFSWEKSAQKLLDGFRQII
jgi:glycosyltransferase involved in cell wall biosynthesis